ncbi:MAG TPA: PKD domain-containing protein [Solirubrobacteraceae bacterium]|nr:PKD domain-containing protein [Solirubrobacteraceae bacterium]
MRLSRGFPVLLMVLATAVLGARAQQAGAVILPAVTIDGPSEEIVGFGGVAMAEDGSGGLVYLKRVEGIAHVFVSRYVGGHWLAPIRVDAEQPYAASWPRIGAADGGELVVVWATPFATNSHGRTIDELLGATLGPGASGFGPGIIVDPNVGEGVGASPDLAMSPTGQADVVYRVVEENENIQLLRAGDVVEQVRVAHYDGQRWARLGSINRSNAVSMRPPTAANAPQIAIGPTGNGVVVWQEPEVEGVARIWARRIFGQSLDYVLPVTTTSISGTPINEDADAPSVTFSRLGQAEVAYRQGAGAGSPLPGPRIFLNTLPDGESVNGAEFLGASVVDSQVLGGDAASVGRPSIDIDEHLGMRLLYDDNGTPRVIEGGDRGLTGALSIGPAFVGSQLAPANELPAVSVMDPEGGGISAWPSANPQGAPEVAVREDFPSGGVQTALVSGGAGGQIGELAVGRSGLGDGLVAFQQGPIGDAAIVASQVTAPPSQFVLTVPNGWVKPSEAVVSWEPAPSADGPLRYAVVLDGRRVATPAGVHTMHLDTRGLGSGTHHVQVLATDIFGQSTLSPPSALRVDGVAPTVKVARAGGGSAVSVRVSDRYSGVASRAITVSFGDGHSARGRTSFRHRYARAGVYAITVHVRDKLGNGAVVRRLVSVS